MDFRSARPSLATPIHFSGLEPLQVDEAFNFVMVGERTNITGSPKFARLIRENDLDGALQIARQQVESGANMIDINMDEGLIDSQAVMVRFLHLVMSEPDISRVPIMIDSSKWEVIEAGLKCVQGKCVVNSISLKEGEDAFRSQARLVKKYGAACIVMAFDEQGQADTTKRRVEICTRAYRILVDELHFDPTNIIFDPNIFPIATGMEEHRINATSFLMPPVSYATPYPASPLAEASATSPSPFEATTPYAKPSMQPFSTTANRRVLTWESSIPACLKSTTKSTLLC